jgi:hypothetical protein
MGVVSMLEKTIIIATDINVDLLALLLIAFLATGVIAFSSTRCRGARRITFRLAGLWLLLPTVIATCFVLISSVSDPNFETALGVAGIILSFFFGVFGSAASMISSHPMKVAILFASKGPFHREIRRGIDEQLALCGAITIDLGSEAMAVREDEVGFLRLLRRTSNLRPDYAIIWAPGESWAEEPELISFAENLYREGGLCIFLENPPPESMQNITLTIAHDAKEGGRLLGQLARQFGAGRSLTSLVLLGPEYSEPARLRNDAIREELDGCENVSLLQLFTWNEADAIDLIRRMSEPGISFDLVVCPNDSIALSLEDSVASENGIEWLSTAKVLGFDGLPRARACVAEAGTIIVGTVSIPPSEYGARAGQCICRLSRPTLLYRKKIRSASGLLKMAISEKHIITRGRARSQLYD